VLEELDQVVRDAARCVVLGGVGQRLIGVVGFDNCNNFLGVDGYMRRSDAIFRCHDQIRFPSRRKVSHGDVVETFERGHAGVDFDDDLYQVLSAQSSEDSVQPYLVRHLDQLWRGSDGSTGNDAALLRNGRSLHDNHVELVVRPIFRIVTLCKVMSTGHDQEAQTRRSLRIPSQPETWTDVCRRT